MNKNFRSKRIKFVFAIVALTLTITGCTKKEIVAKVNNTEITKDETEEQRSYKVGILINGSSASASEVLASALKYSYGASLIGTKSYGKGKVQQTSNLSDGAMIKYTTARWLTPEGNCIDGVGLTPDVEKELPESTEEGQVVEDTQLNAAVEYLSN